MSEAKPTPGPLRIQADDKWPFYIRTIDAAGDCVFREDMPAYSTAQRSLAECLAGKRMSGDQDRAVCANAVALANAELRAEAHNVLTTTGLTPSQLLERVKELEELLNGVLLMGRGTSGRIIVEGWQEEVLRAALSKARPNTAEGEVTVEAPTHDEELPEAVMDAVAAALGDAYDCCKVWSAWSYGTMHSDDFSLVAEDGERVAEISRAAIDAYRAARTEAKEPSP